MWRRLYHGVKCCEMKKGGCLAWYGNTMPLKQQQAQDSLIISELYIEGIDYLQVFGMGTKKRKSKRFVYNELAGGTRAFRQQGFYFDKSFGIRVAHIMSDPVNGVMPPRSIMIKFDNEVLYLKAFNLKYVKMFFNAIGFEYKYLSRLDIYRDFQQFKEYDPEDFIRQYINEEIKLLSRAKFNVIGVNRFHGLGYQYLRIGKKNTGRQVYLYNKSIELLEIGEKNYIKETWHEVGFSKSFDVWRLEISLTKGARNILLDLETGEMVQAEISEVFKTKAVHDLYESGLNTIFQFVRGNRTRKTNMEKIRLFRGKKRNVKLVRSKENIDNLRMKKIILKSLIKDVLSDAEKREHKSKPVMERIEFISGFVVKHNLIVELDRIIEKLAIEFKISYDPNLYKFVMNYYSRFN